MKILVVSSRYFPEPFTITSICETFVKKGHDVTVLTGQPNYGQNHTYEGYENVFRDTVNGVKIIRAKVKSRGHGVLSLIRHFYSYKKGFKKEINKINENFDIVISHGLSPLFTIDGVKKLCKRLGIPHLHYGLDMWPESFIASGHLKRHSLFFYLIKKYSIRLYLSCDYITFSSQCFENYMREYLRINKPFKQIYQPCLTEVPKLSSILKNNYKAEKVHILYCGNLAPFLRLDLMIRAMNCPDIKNNIIFDIVGSGPEFLKIRKLVNKLHLQDNVVFYGRVSKEETKTFYFNTDYVYIPLYKNSETGNIIPQKVLEVLMYGRPIFGMIKGNGRELIEDASKKNIIADQNVESIKSSLFKIINQRSDDLIECGKENRLFFDSNKRFQLDVICEELLEVANGLVSNKEQMPLEMLNNKNE